MSDTLFDIGNAAMGNIGDSYQQILLQDSGISAPEALPTEYETVTTTIEPDVGGVELESYGPPSNDAIAGLDIG